MNDNLAEFLLDTPGRTLLDAAQALRDSRTEILTALTRLRKSATSEQASAAWEMTELRGRGQTKFGPDAAKMYFVREALEQASGAATAAYHARRLVVAGAREVADLGGGIGGDALAFARAGLQVTVYERDPIRARFAKENVEVSGFTDLVQIVAEDVTASQITAEAIWLDPARRRDSRRVSDPEEYSPPLSYLHTLTAKAIGVKLSPGVDHALAETFGAELEFLSEGGECREALLWKGSTQTGEKLRATVLTGEEVQTLAGAADRPGSGTLRASGSVLYEPDPAVIRAHLVGTLAGQLDAGPMDFHIAYLLADSFQQTPFATGYTILEQLSYNPKRLQAALTARNAGRLIVKKRGFPLEPDAVRKLFKLRGTEEITLILARVGSGHQAFLCVPAG